MSSFGKRITGPVSRRTAVRRQLGLTGSLVALNGSRSVVVEDLCPNGARLLGKRLAEPGKEVLLRTSELALFGRIAWADREHRGVSFEDGERPSVGLCLALQLRGAE